MADFPRISLRKAMRILVISTFLISGVPWIIYVSYAYLWHLRTQDSSYAIIALTQMSSDSELLKTEFITEILQLSMDKPSNLYQFDLIAAKKRLLQFAPLKNAEIQRIPPGILSVSYSMRKPVAFLADLSNTAIDEDKCLFPFHPFYSPKNLPVLFVGLKQDDMEWGIKIFDERLDLAFKVLKLVDGIHRLDGLSRIVIDVSQVNAASLGEQKIIVVISEKLHHHSVMLNPLNFKEGFDRYLAVKEEIPYSAKIDLRLEKLGFIQKEPYE